MKSVKITKYILLIGLTVLFLWVCPLFAEDDSEECIDLIQAAESGILARINLARNNPWAEAERLGLNITELREQVGELVASQWDEGLPPLQWNEQLASAATCHVQDMFERFYYSHTTPEGIGPNERIRAAGYDPIFWGESLGSVAFIKVISAERATRIICDGLLKDAFSQEPEGMPLLDPLLRDMGLYLGGGQLLINDSWYNAYILVCDLGCVQEAVPYYGQEGVLFGRLFADVDGNGLYSYGEELAGELVFFFPFDFSMSLFTYTYSDGSFFFSSTGDNGYLVPVFFGDAVPRFWLINYIGRGDVVVNPVVLPEELKSISP